MVRRAGGTLCSIVGSHLSLPAFIKSLVENKDAWYAFSQFAGRVILAKEVKERNGEGAERMRRRGRRRGRRASSLSSSSASAAVVAVAIAAAPVGW